MNTETLTATVRGWLSEWTPRWQSLGVQAQLRVPTEAGLSKVAVTLDAQSHVASLTVWGRGTLEFIALEVATQREALMEDREFVGVEELRRLLDDSAESFQRLLS